MDRTAIEAIADLATSQALATPDFIILNDKQNLETLEHFKERPNRFVGQFKTNNLTEFTNYLNVYADANTGLYIDPEQAKATAIIDQGDSNKPGWGKHYAHLTLIQLPEYRELLSLNNKTLSQQSFIDFVEDFPHCFCFFDVNLNPITKDLSAIIQQLRHLTINGKSTSSVEISNYSQSATAMEKLEIKAAGEDQLPAGFHFNFVPFDDFSDYTLKCQLRAISQGDGVQLKYRIIGLTAIQKLIAVDMQDMIRDKIVEIEGLKSYLGQMSYR